MQNSIALSSITAFWIRNLSYSILLLTTMSIPVGSQTVQLIGQPQTSLKNEEVTIKVRVLNGQKKPIPDIEEGNFKVIVDGKTEKEIPFERFSPPGKNQSYPAYIVVLLDLSGSMAGLDSKGTTKIKGAINAIRELNKATQERGGNTYISIVPFGEPGKDCPGFIVDENALNKFFIAGDEKIISYLNNLGDSKITKICAKTNLYEPLTKAVNFLGNKSNPQFYPSLDRESKKPKTIDPVLSIILLSDGYHNQGNESEDFAKLTTLLKSNSNITVHTLGYGKTPAELGKEHGLKRPATRQDVGIGPNKVPEAEFVDEKRLKEIADLTGGIAEFSPNSKDVGEKLKLFLDAILGYYEIAYIEPNPDRGTKHNVYVEVKHKNEQLIGKSDPKDYKMFYFGRLITLDKRSGVVIGIVSLMIVGGVPFYFWGKYLKNNS